MGVTSLCELRNLLAETRASAEQAAAMRDEAERILQELRQKRTRIRLMLTQNEARSHGLWAWVRSFLWI